ncbi:MAG: homoserine kinase [Anaerolineae bacterium]|nr:homoserine kinase [Anaerolineae bacterium]
MSPDRITVRVPATTANLGPGFDAFGLALDMWNEAVFCLEGCETYVDFTDAAADSGQLPTGGDNLIARSFAFLYEKRGLTPPAGLHITCTNRVPTGSGMGSSATAVLSGLAAANAFLANPYDKDGLLELATELEGHPDNAAAGIFGGLTVSLTENGRILTRRFDVPPFSVALAVPSFYLPTRAARAALPECVPIKDAVFNISRAVMVVEALRDGDLDLLGRVLDDRLHQPYRFKLIPGCFAAQDAARSAGARAVALSGAGPSLLAFSAEADCPAVAAAMQRAYESAGLACRSFVLATSPVGVQVSI